MYARRHGRSVAHRDVLCMLGSGVLRDCAFKRGSLLSKGPATRAILQIRICPFLPWLSGCLQLWPKFWPETLTHAFIRVNLESQTGDGPTFHPRSAPNSL